MTKFFHYAFAASLCFISTTYAASNVVTKDKIFTPAQTKQIEEVVHDYLLNNPQVIIESMQSLQKQETQKYIVEIKSQIPKHIKELSDAKAPGRETIGSNKPDIIIAEFFSYQCPNCRMMPPVIEKLISEHKNLQVMLIGWSFEGNDDIYAAKVDLAAQKQGKYYDLYTALMKEPGVLTQESIEKVAKSIGLDMDKLHTDMNDSAIDKSLKSNFDLAKDLKLVGTPTFIITNKTFSKFSVIFGRASAQDLQKAIDEVR